MQRAVTYINSRIAAGRAALPTRTTTFSLSPRTLCSLACPSTPAVRHVSSQPQPPHCRRCGWPSPDRRPELGSVHCDVRPLVSRSQPLLDGWRWRVDGLVYRLAGPSAARRRTLASGCLTGNSGSSDCGSLDASSSENNNRRLTRRVGFTATRPTRPHRRPRRARRAPTPAAPARARRQTARSVFMCSDIARSRR